VWLCGACWGILGSVCVSPVWLRVLITQTACVSCVTLTCHSSHSSGESDPIKKNPEEDPWIRSGTQVCERV
jgi:hypothetical protein